MKWFLVLRSTLQSRVAGPAHSAQHLLNWYQLVNLHFHCVLGSQQVSAAILTWVMGQRYMQTSKIMPAGLVAGISALMTAFYIYELATGGNHLPAKKE